MDAARECQTCDGNGRVEVFVCKGVCECGMCPELEDCPECCGREANEIIPEYTNEQFAAMRRECAEDDLLAVGSHYLDANGTLQPKSTT